MEYEYSYGSTLSPEVGVGIMLASFLIPLVIFLVIYVYFAVTLMIIARKTNTANGWFAWIPILNIILMLQIAQKPVWWIILLLIPLVNIIIQIIVWMGIAEARGKPSWVGILMIIPFVNFIIPGYLAFSK